MPLLLSEIRLTPDQDENDLKTVVADLIQVPPSEIKSFRIIRRSVDARHDVRLLYQIEITVNNEESLSQKIASQGRFSVQQIDTAPTPWMIKKHIFPKRPVVVGFGPAGIFAARILAEAGARPIVLERGGQMKDRIGQVEDFWTKGNFHSESNVCFGEGGAGTFSDGKLTTRKRSPEIPWLFQALVDAGAPSDILYEARPHIGTDRLRRVIINLRKHIESMGGEVRFRSPVTDFLVRDGKVCGVRVNNHEEIMTDTVILAPGHGAGDTFAMLQRLGVKMESKALAIGVRVEHPQEVIDKAQYGRWAGHERLGASDYRLTYRDRRSNRGIYSFCMCPGGKVIGVNSEEKSVVTNGMSTYRRDSGYANSGLVVTVRGEDFGGSDPLAGLAFVRKWEKEAFHAGGGGYCAPAQRVSDFLKNKVSSTLPSVTYRPGVISSDMRDVLPDFAADGLQRALKHWGRKIPGFVSDQAVLIGVETRTSSPVRILRGEDFVSLTLRGLYPIGEGAGYAGGIVSSALDGLYCVESIISGRIRKYGGI